MTRDPAASHSDFVVLRDETAGRWLRFRHPVATVVATRIEEVLPGLREVEERTVSMRRLGEQGSRVATLDDAVAGLAVEGTPPDLR